MIEIYYKHRKTQSQIKSQLSNKLMLFIADSIDKCINGNFYGELCWVKGLLGRVYRRFSKEILQRLLIFYNSKIVQVQGKDVKDMKEFLMKISRVKKSKDKRVKS